MRNTRKILVALVLVLAMMMSMATLFASAAESESDEPAKLYLVPNSNWTQANARFAAYFFGNGEKWVSMTKSAKSGEGICELDTQMRFSVS